MEERSLCDKQVSKETAIKTSLWRLRRYGRFLPRNKESGGNCSWKVVQPSESAGELVLTLLESGHLLVFQAQELLEGFSLLDAPGFLKVQQKSDSLIFQFTVQGESRTVRLQFAGSSRSEAMEECGSAVRRLQEYLPVRTQENAPPPPHSSTKENAPPPHCSTQPPTQPAASVQQQQVLDDLLR